MRIVVIAGGVGSARLCAGLVRVVDPKDVTVIVNTGDDDRIRGLHVSPDVDTVLYHLAGLTDWERGWGLGAESFVADERYKELVARAGGVDVDAQEWFALGDRDLATHMLRTRLLDAGRTLSEATDAVRRGLGIDARVLPKSDDPVRTKLVTTDRETLAFQEYFVRRRHADEIAEVVYEGVEDARPAPGVIEAIESADIIVFPPSNPFLSIWPVLGVDGIRGAIEHGHQTFEVAVSPIVGGRALKGPADMLMRSLGYEVSPNTVARLYDPLVSFFVFDEADRDRAERIGRAEPVVMDTVMSSPERAARLAKELLHIT